MRLAILTVGTRGDTQPYVALGDALSRRGHHVSVALSEDLVPFARAAGLHTVPYRGFDVRATLEADAQRALLADGKVTRFFKTVAEAQARHLDAFLEAFTRAVEDSEAVVTHPLVEVAGFVAARTRGVPLVRTMLAPMVETGAFCSPLLPRFSLGSRLLNRGSHRAMIAGVWWAARRSHRTACRKLGLKPLPGNGHRFIERAQVPTAHLTSPTLLPRPDDWASHHVQTGHCALPPPLRERLGEARVPAALEAWLGEGPPPVFFGLGSLPILEPERWLERVEAAVEPLGLRALVGAGWSRFVHRPPSRLLFLAGALDHDAVLPRCVAAVHHGGLGTTTTALRSGLPALVCSVMADQPFLGERLARLGVGVHTRFSKLGAEGLRRGLEQVLAPRMREQAAALGAQMRHEPGAEVAADFVERSLSA